MSLLLACLLAAAPPLHLRLDAEDTFAARGERAVGAAALATTSLGAVSLEMRTAVGRDIPLVDQGSTEAKLGWSAAMTLALGAFDVGVIGVLENGEPRIDAALTAQPLGLNAAAEVEGLRSSGSSSGCRSTHHDLARSCRPTA